MIRPIIQASKLPGLTPYRQQKRKETGPTGTEHDAFSRLEVLRQKDPESYVKYRKRQVMNNNLIAGSGMLDTSSASVLPRHNDGSIGSYLGTLSFCAELIYVCYQR